MFSYKLQHFHHGCRGDQVVTGQSGAIHHHGITHINTGFFFQYLTDGLLAGTQCPHAVIAAADGAENFIGNHIVGFFQHFGQQSMQRSGLCLYQYGARLFGWV